uniref:Uncharacterized protein n=1 Tax=Arundo donax TaxID=35708 RepID=A0A0A9BIM3_ARUDO
MLKSEDKLLPAV